MEDLLSTVRAVARGLEVARLDRRDPGRRGNAALACLALVIACAAVTGAEKLDWMLTVEGHAGPLRLVEPTG